MHGADYARGRERCGYAAALGPAVCERCERLRQLRVVERLWTDGAHRSARLGQALARECDGRLEMLAVISVARPRLFSGLQLRDHPGEALGKGVVDLAR